MSSSEDETGVKLIIIITTTTTTITTTTTTTNQAALSDFINLLTQKHEMTFLIYCVAILPDLITTSFK